MNKKPKYMMENKFKNKRLKDLHSLKLLDTTPEKEYDTITSLAAFICDTPISLVSLVTDTRQFFKSHHGIDITETNVENSFCDYTIKVPQKFFIVEDARKDNRFKDTSLVIGNSSFIFYAGIPLITKEGNALGTLCVIDHKPRKLDEKQLEALTSLANQVVQLFELRKNRLEIKEMANNFADESQRLHTIISATRVGTWEWHIPSDKINLNERWAEMLGYTLEELKPLSSESIQRLIFPKDFETLTEKIMACLEKKSDFYVGEHRFLHKKGHVVWIHDRGQVVSWTKDGKPLLMAGTHTDITELKNTETQFSTITNNIPGAVFRYQRYPEGKDELRLVSNGAKSLWGFSAEEVMQNNNLIWERYDDKDLKAHLRTIKNSAEDLSFWKHEWRYHHPDGTIRWHKGFGNPVRLKNDTTIWDSVIFDITTQKENELKIEKSEKRFKGLVQNGSDLITILDFKGNYNYVSPTSRKILGIPPEEFVEKNALEFIHPDDKETFYASLLSLKNEKQVAIKPFRFKHGDGSWRWMETFVTNLMEDSSVGGLVANSKDITERKLTEDKLKKSEAYYRGLYESQTNYVLRTDMDGNYTYVNKKFVEEFGWLYADEKILGNNCMGSIMDYHHQKTQETVGQCVAEPGKVFKIEIDKPSSDGRILTTLWDFVCVEDSDGKPSEIQCMGLDITDRIKSEKALKESEHRYSDLFQLSPQPKFVYDMATLKFLDVNQSAIEHYGYSYDEFMNMSISEIRPESEIPKFEATLKRAQEKGKQTFLGEHIHRKKNGKEIVVEIRINNLTYKGKEAKVVLVTDITERHNHMKAIEAQNERFRKIAWTQSHEVRAPLARIMGMVELLKVDYTSTKEKELLLKHILFSATELDDIVRDIVDATQQEEI
jgi:PAS domain S-box-containing protein